MHCGWMQSNRSLQCLQCSRSSHRYERMYFQYMLIFGWMKWDWKMIIYPNRQIPACRKLDAVIRPKGWSCLAVFLSWQKKILLVIYCIKRHWADNLMHAQMERASTSNEWSCGFEYIYPLLMDTVCLSVCVRSCSAAGAGGDAEAERGGWQAKRRAEGQSPGDNHHLQRGGGGKDTHTIDFCITFTYALLNLTLVASVLFQFFLYRNCSVCIIFHLNFRHCERFFSTCLLKLFNNYRNHCPEHSYAITPHIDTHLQSSHQLAWLSVCQMTAVNPLHWWKISYLW